MYHRSADEDIDDVLAAVARRVDGLLARRRVVEQAEAGDVDPWSDREPVLAGLSAASVQGRLALGRRPGAEVRRCGAHTGDRWRRRVNAPARTGAR